MPRYPWIRPKKPIRIPSTRPVTILDTPPPDGGWEYRASYCGVPLQVFSQAPINGTLLQAGDTIIARWVPGAEQLWFPSPEAGGLLYFTPGGAGTQQAPGPGELWSYNGIIFVHHWTCPNALEMITCLSWHANYLWVFTAEPTLAPGVPPNIRMYRYDISTDIATHLIGHDALLIAHWNIFDLSLPLLDSAEYSDGLLYILQTPGRVLRYDAATDTLTEVKARPGSNEEMMGGIAIFGNPPTALVASDGITAWTSPTGNLGSWIFSVDFPVTFDVDRIISLLTAPDAEIYCAVHRPLGIGWHTTCVLRFDGVNWNVEFDNPNANYKGANACSVLRPAGSVDVGMNGGDAIGDDLSIAIEVPPWGFDWVGPVEPPNYVLGIEQNLVCRSGQICALYQYLDMDFGTKMYVRSTAGVWSLARTWALYYPFHVSEWEPKMYWSLLPMTLVQTALKPHEM